MAHRSRIKSASLNVGWFDQHWRYDYEVIWQAGNAAIREVKIDKTVGACVTVRRFFGGGDPRRDLRAPTGWTLVTRAGQFEFMIQPPPGGPLAGFIPPLRPPAPFAPVGVGPISGMFRVYSVENPVALPAFTVDHLNARFPAGRNHIVQAPNNKIECSKITASCDKEKKGFRYSYTISAEVGDIWQGILFLPKEVAISSIRTSDKAWSTYRAGFDKPTDLDRADGGPTPDEDGILYFGSFIRPVSRDTGSVTMSFFSTMAPGFIPALGNNFSDVVVGPVAEQFPPKGKAARK